MTQLPETAYKILNQILEVLELTDEEKDEYKEKFEENILQKFSEAIVKKLPPEVAKETAEKANGAKSEADKKLLQQKLSEWLTPEESQELFTKIAEEYFGEFVKVAYDTATGEQKLKLEAMFPQEVLKS